MPYIWGFLGTFVAYGFNWWFSLFVAYIFGIGFFANYARVKDSINVWQSWITMPDSLSIWWLLFPFFFWIIIRLAHEEGLKRLRRSFLIFEKPYVERSVPLFRNRTELQSTNVVGSESAVVVQARVSNLVAQNDIAKIVVRNVPYDYENGRSVEDAYARVTFYRKDSWSIVRMFDYPRWTENPKPGYEGNPSDHFPDEWNYRTLRSNGGRNTVDFALKSIDEQKAYGFQGSSQRTPNWKNEELSLDQGEYIVRIDVYGAGLRRSPRSFWLYLENPGKDKALYVDNTRERIGTVWYNGFVRHGRQ